MATGDITIAINADGWSADLSVAGFTSPATYDLDWRGRIPGTYISGTFTNGETVTQAATGSTAIVVGAQSSGTFLLVKTLNTSAAGTSDGLYLTPAAGATSSSNGYWVGGTSGASFQPRGAPAMTIAGPNTPYFTVVRQGHDNTGTLGTVTDTVYVTTNVLDPYSTATIPGTYISGTFTDGETVTASVSTRTALVVGNQASGAILRVKKVSGATNAADVWTGATGIFNASATHTTLTLPKNDELAPTGSLTTRVALSDYIYLDDNTGAGKSGTAPTFTIAASVISSGGNNSNALTNAAVTQSSTQDYANTIARFVTLPYKRLTGAFTVECQAFNRHARNGFPVAAVKFTFADGTVTRTQIITAMSLSADTDQVPVYAASDNASNFTQGASVTCKIECFPWVGDADNVADSSTGTWQSATGGQLSNLPVGVCATGSGAASYPNTYCCVDNTNGNDANLAFSTAAAAEAAPVQNYSKALKRIQDYNNANYSRNTVDAGIILLKGGSHLQGVGGETITAHSKCEVIVQPASTDTQTTAIITGFNATSRASNSIVRFAGITIAASSSTNQLISFPRTACPNMFDTVILTGAGSTTNLLSGTNGVPAAIFKNCTTTGYLNGYIGGNDNIALLIRGGSLSGVTGSGGVKCARCVTGLSYLTPTSSTFYPYINATVGWTETGNIVLSYNKVFGSNGIFFLSSGGTAMADVAIVANVMERAGAGTSAMVEISAAPITNILLWHNTCAGERVNTEGAVTGGAGTGTNYVYQLASYKYNSWQYNGTHNQGDVHVANSLITGQWPYSQYDVGWAGNNGEIRAIESFSFLGIGSSNQTVAGYTNDLSRGGNVTAAGSYTSGSFLANEVVIQTGTGVLAYSGAAQSAGATLALYGIYGATSNNSGTWVGKTSGAIFTPAAIPTTGAGTGNYQPTAASILVGKVPSGGSVISYDLARVAIPNNGTGAAGAYQIPVSAVTTTNQSGGYYRRPHILTNRLVRAGLA